MIRSLPGPRLASYAAVVLALAVVSRAGLDLALLAGLFALLILEQTQLLLREAGARPFLARWAAVALLGILGILLSAILFSFVHLGLARLPQLLDRLLPRIDALAARFGFDWTVDSSQDLKIYVAEAAKVNARSITKASGLVTRDFFQIVVAVAIAVMRFLTVAAPRGVREGVDGELFHACAERLRLFTASFERVMGAQIVIAAINTGVTAAFLFALRVPFRTALTLATFVFGMLPIIGNIVSNALIVAAALTVSDGMAFAALVFLILIHKAQYFLNSRILAARIDTPMWATLTGLLVGEALMGVSGMILAPTLIYYFREELRALPARGAA